MPRSERLRCLLPLLILSCLMPAAALAVPPGTVGDLYVTGDVSNTVRVYTGTGGSFLGVFTPTTNSPLAVHFGVNNGRMLVGGFAGVAEYDVATGAFIKSYGPAAWQWAAIYRPNGNVLVSETPNNLIREYDGNTGLPIGVFATLPGGPSDMRYGPNGNLYVALYVNTGVCELDPVSGAIVTAWPLPPGSRANDVEFLNGEILVTALGTNLVYRYDSTPVHNLLGTFGNGSWGNTHGIVVSPHDGHIYVVDGVTAQVHVFHPTTFAEVTPAFLAPPPGDKVVDPEFRPAFAPTPADRGTWGRIKALYR
jgi:hypothetical protein